MNRAFPLENTPRRNVPSLSAILIYLDRPFLSSKLPPPRTTVLTLRLLNYVFTAPSRDEIPPAEHYQHYNSLPPIRVACHVSATTVRSLPRISCFLTVHSPRDNIPRCMLLLMGHHTRSLAPSGQDMYHTAATPGYHRTVQSPTANHTQMHANMQNQGSYYHCCDSYDAWDPLPRVATPPQLATSSMIPQLPAGTAICWRC